MALLSRAERVATLSEYAELRVAAFSVCRNKTTRKVDDACLCRLVRALLNADKLGNFNESDAPDYDALNDALVAIKKLISNIVQHDPTGVWILFGVTNDACAGTEYDKALLINYLRRLEVYKDTYRKAAQTAKDVAIGLFKLGDSTFRVELSWRDRSASAVIPLIHKSDLVVENGKENKLIKRVGRLLEEVGLTPDLALEVALEISYMQEYGDYETSDYVFATLNELFKDVCAVPEGAEEENLVCGEKNAALVRKEDDSPVAYCLPAGLVKSRLLKTSEGYRERLATLHKLGILVAESKDLYYQPRICGRRMKFFCFSAKALEDHDITVPECFANL